MQREGATRKIEELPNFHWVSQVGIVTYAVSSAHSNLSSCFPAEAFLLSMFKQISTLSCRTAPLAYCKAPPAGPSAERSSACPVQVFMRLLRDAELGILELHTVLESRHSRKDLAAGVSPTKGYQPALVISLSLVSCTLSVGQKLMISFLWIFERFLSVSIA